MSLEDGTPVRLTVPADMDRIRADKVIAGITGFSRAMARRLIETGRVTVGGEPVTVTQKLAAGDAVQVVEPLPREGLPPLALPLQIRYESDTTLVVDKPPGLVVHPGAGHRDDTLASVLIHHYPELAGLGEECRWGLVHRLDRDTSGLLLVGRTAAAHRALQAQLKGRDIKRTYLALVQARIEPATGTIEAPIGRDPDQPTRMALRQDGRFARTHYRRVAAWDDVSLVEVNLETGRTHQIRVHFKSIGAPIVGDRTYGAHRGGVEGFHRVWLHAHQLVFIDPAGPSDPVTVTSPLPSDLQDSLKLLGQPLTGAVPAAARYDGPRYPDSGKL